MAAPSLALALAACLLLVGRAAAPSAAPLRVCGAPGSPRRRPACLGSDELAARAARRGAALVGIGSYLARPPLRGGGSASDSAGTERSGAAEGLGAVVGDVVPPDPVDPTLEEARDLWTRAVDASPQDAPLLLEYALFLQDDARDWLGAERIYKRVIGLQPRNAAALTNYATILSDHRQDLTSAESAFQLALAINPDDGTALANYAALLLEKRHEPRRAQDLYLHALHADPTNIATLYNYAAMLEEHADDLSGASRLLQVALHLDPASAASRQCRERLAALVRQRARRAAEEARRQQPQPSDPSGVDFAQTRRGMPPPLVQVPAARAQQGRGEAEVVAGGVARERAIFRSNRIESNRIASNRIESNLI